MIKNRMKPINVLSGKNAVLLNLLAPCVLYIGQAFLFSPENAFYIFNQRIYFIT